MENHVKFESPEEYNMGNGELLNPGQPNEKTATVSKHHCGICNITYQTLKGIHLHNLKMHDPEAVWCHICHRPFKKKENFEKHNLQFHSSPQDQKKSSKSRKPSKWAPRPIVLASSMVHPAPEPVVEQAPKRTRVEEHDEFSSQGFHRMDPSSLTAYAWELMTRNPFPVAGPTSKIMPPSAFLTSTGIQPTSMSYQPALMSSFQAAPRGRDFWGEGSSRMAEEGSSRSVDAFSKNNFVVSQEVSHPQIDQPTCAFEALTDKFKPQPHTLPQQYQPKNGGMMHYFEAPQPLPQRAINQPNMGYYPPEQRKQEPAMKEAHSEEIDLNSFFSDFIPNPAPDVQLWNTLSTMYPNSEQNYSIL